MAEPPVTSTSYPFLPIRVEIRGHRFEGEALLDTGFIGHLAMSASMLNGLLGLPDTRTTWELADQSTIGASVYIGTVEIVGLLPVPAAIIALGREYILGRGVIDRFKITFDHGQRVIVEP